MAMIKFASIILTYRCNARCHMCNTWQHPSQPEEEITADDLAKLPEIPSINVTGGEPFLRDDLAELLSVLRTKARRVVISTNGYLTDRIIDTVRQHPWVGVRISLEGLPKANDELRGLSDGFDHGIRTLIALSDMGLKDIGFGITLSDRNVSDVLELFHLAKMMGVEFSTAAVHNSYYFHKMDNRFTNIVEARRVLSALIAELLQSRHAKDWFRAYFNHGLLGYIEGAPRLLPCRMGHDAFFLDPYGEIFPCNVMERTMGNIKQQDFSQIWNSAEAEDIRRRVKNCEHNCWMIGSVAEPMKDNITLVLRWIMQQKLRGVPSGKDSLIQR